MHLGRLTIVKEENKERAHSMFSASGSERWEECPGSVKICEPLPDKDTVWSIEGTWAHAVLEMLLIYAISNKTFFISGAVFTNREVNRDMVNHGIAAANFILGLYQRTPGSDFLVETRIYLKFIHPEMFGTFDSAILHHFATLHVFDYKYGAGHAVRPVKNLQMIFYGIGLAYKYGWNFKRIRLWIYQPRIKGFDGPVYWDISIAELKSYVPRFQAAVDRVLENPDQFNEGSWCHWCKAKKLCPVKTQGRLEKAQTMFKAVPLLGVNYGKEESIEEKDNQEVNFKSEADWRKEKARRKGKASKAKKGKQARFS